MQRFTKLFWELDQSTKTNDKLAALEDYFRTTAPEDAVWALRFLAGKTPARVVSSRNLWDWVAIEANLPHWLMQECYDAVGDFGETLALLFPDPGQGITLGLAQLITQKMLPLRQLGELSRRELLVSTWREMNSAQRLVWNKLITGEFRVGVSRTLVIRALANVAGVEPAVMAHRILGNWEPTAEAYKKLLVEESGNTETARAYPFFLASPLETKVRSEDSIDTVLGDIAQWQAEWKWDGIRAQLIRRNDETCLWSRGDEMVTETFPEIVEASKALPNGTVLDGEIVAWKRGHADVFTRLQRRLGRKNVSSRMQAEFPVAFVAFDILEWAGEDWRGRTLSQRRAQLESVLASARLDLSKAPIKMEGGTPFLFEELQPELDTECAILASPVLHASTWSELGELRARARERGVEGLMLKRMDSVYGVGRQRGDWWKWKIEPFVIDAVLIYAQYGHGRRASLFTDYTFGLWEGEHLVPVAKAYSGLTDAEIRQVDLFVRRNTIEKHGSVRVVKPELVFELAFEGIQASNRHKAGVAVRFPRMNRWRHDKKAEEADNLETLKALFNVQSQEHTLR